MQPRTSLTLFALLLLATAATGQAKLEWGEDFREPGNSVLTEILHVDDDHFYTLRVQARRDISNESKVYLEKYRRERMSLSRSEEIDMSYKKKVRRFEEILVTKGGKMHLLTSFQNRARETSYLFRQELRARSLAPGRSLDMVLDVPGANGETAGPFAVRISPDSSKVVLMGDVGNETTPDGALRFATVDADFQPLQSWSEKPISETAGFQVEEFQVDNAGNVYLLGLTNLGKKRRRRQGPADYFYSLRVHPADGSAARSFKFRVPNVFLSDLTFRPARDGKLVVAGFYSETATFNVRGSAYFRLDPTTMEIEAQQISEFDLEFRAAFLSERQARRASRDAERAEAIELPNLSLDHLVLRSDGGALLIAERFFVQRIDYNNNFGGWDPVWGWNTWNRRYYNDVDYNFVYEDIFVINIRPDGTVEWANNIAKRQESIDDGGYFSSYVHAVTGTGIHFIFNDDPVNFSGTDNLRTYTPNRGGVIALATVDRDGNITAQPLGETREAGVVTRPKVCKQSGRNTLLLYGERGRKFRFGRVRF